MSRSAPAEFVERLRRMDARLDVLWHNFGDGRVVPGCWNRWRVVIKDAAGRLAHLFVVAEPDGGYRDLDDRVLEKLHRMDAHRFYDAEQLLAWSRENPSEEDAEAIRARQFMDARFHDSIEQLADELAKTASDADEAHVTAEGARRELDRHRKRHERLDAVAAAYEAGSGRIVLDPKDGLPRVVG